jgi:hypothetical protein
MDGMPGETEALRLEHLRRLNEALGERGRAYYSGVGGCAWEVKWFSEQKNRTPD